MECRDFIYAGTSLYDLPKLLYRGLRICDNSNTEIIKKVLGNECHIALHVLAIRPNIDLSLFMHKQTENKCLFKKL